MPLETGTYISDLVTSNPAHSDGLNQADAHIRLLKNVLRTTLPNINGAVTITDEQLNALASNTYAVADGALGAPSFSFAAQPTCGIYRVSGFTVGISGNLQVSNQCDVGANLNVAGGATANAMTIATTLSTGGAATISGTLGVAGAAAFSSSVSVAGSFTAGSYGAVGATSLSTSGNASVGGTLSVTGTTTVGGAFGVSGRASGNGMIPAGFMATFPKVPSRFATGGSGTAGACDWVECDGSLYPMSSFPDLGAFLGSTFGGDGVTNFGMPNLTSTGRFVRSRSSGHAEGTSQSNAIKSHTASVSGTTADHGHTATVHEGSGHSHTGGQAHTRSFGVAAGSNNIWGGAADSTDPATTGLTVTLDTPGGLAVSGTASYSGDTETRPEAFTAVICLKS